jgi:predicted transposase/invertase (TIGR01784 family)
MVIVLFLRNDISEGELNEIMDIDGDIKRAEERLEYLSADPQTQELYFEREKAIHDQANIYSTGVNRGVAQGRLQEKIEIAKSLLDVLPVDIIAQKTGLTVEEINGLKN